VFGSRAKWSRSLCGPILDHLEGLRINHTCLRILHRDSEALPAFRSALSVFPEILLAHEGVGDFLLPGGRGSQNFSGSSPTKSLDVALQYFTASSRFLTLRANSGSVFAAAVRVSLTAFGDSLLCAECGIVVGIRLSCHVAHLGSEIFELINGNFRDSFLGGLECEITLREGLFVVGLMSPDNSSSSFGVQSCSTRCICPVGVAESLCVRASKLPNEN